MVIRSGLYGLDVPRFNVEMGEGPWLAVAHAFERDTCLGQGNAWLETLSEWISQGRAVWASESTPKWGIHRLNCLFFSGLELKAISAATNPSAMYIQTVIHRRTGNCLALSMFYLVMAEAIGIPIVPILGDRHVFVRYDDGRFRQNIETTRQGRNSPDCFYTTAQRGSLHRETLHVLSKREFMALMLVTQAAYMHMPQASWDMAERDLEQALALFPNCPYAHSNRAIVRRRLRCKAGSGPDTEVATAPICDFFDERWFTSPKAPIEGLERNKSAISRPNVAEYWQGGS